MKKIDKYHYHEILDRSYVANDHFHEYVENHPAVTANPELKKEAEKVTAIMYKFYCLCSHYCSIGPSDRATCYDKDLNPTP